MGTSIAGVSYIYACMVFVTAVSPHAKFEKSMIIFGTINIGNLRKIFCVCVCVCVCVYIYIYIYDRTKTTGEFEMF